MVHHVRSCGISGIDGFNVSVECSLSGGLPGFDIVGLPDAAVKEARDRVRSAIKNCGYRFPVSRVTVNLAPADRKKVGSVYDLPILLSILAASEIIAPLPEDSAFIGEISLMGKLRPIPGVLSMALHAKHSNIKKLFIPKDNTDEARLVDGIEIFPVEHVTDLLSYLQGLLNLEPISGGYVAPVPSYDVDFSEVTGQESVKRALEVASAGGHNILLIGPPGSGKSMLAKRIPTILPDMTHEEILESTSIYSISGRTIFDTKVISERPFRSPHHTMTHSAMSGGSQLLPGEISLAHNGVLFLDELPEFHRDVIESLRQPMEDGEVTISRASGVARYPSRFMLVCAMNPCKCGWYGDSSGKCTCTQQSVDMYRSKVSGPLLDRIDIYVEVPLLKYEALRDRVPSEKSSVIKARVNRARTVQQERYKGLKTTCNAQVPPDALHKFCKLDSECDILMHNAYDSLGLSARSYDKILRVARTIADLDDTPITASVLAEAIQYRSYDFKSQKNIRPPKNRKRTEQ